MRTLLLCVLLLSGVAAFASDAVPAASGTPVLSPELAAAREIWNSMIALSKNNDTTASSWDAIDAKINDYQKNFAGDEKAQKNVARLRRFELSGLKHLPDQAAYNALLQKLTADPLPQVATMAKTEQARDELQASLKTKPVDLGFTDVNGNQIDLAKLRGKVVLIDFWATWCGPCRREVPDVVAAYRKYHDQGFEIVGISLDQDKAALLDFTKQNGMVWPQYFDGGGWKNKISQEYGINSIPTMWLIDKQGMLATTEGRKDLAGQVQKLLAQ